MAAEEPNKRLIRDLKWAASWERVRRRRRWHFLWIHGALGWGVPVAAWTIAWDWWHRWRESGALPPVTRIAISLAIFIVAGLFWGAWMWRYSERRFLRIIAERDGPTARVFE